MKTLKRSALPLGGLALILALALGSCSGESRPESATMAPGAPAGAPSPGPGGPSKPGAGGLGTGVQTVQALTVTTGTLLGENTTSGTVAALWQSKVPAQVSGMVSQILLSQGDWVKAGQTVVQLDTTQLDLTLADAQATLENAKISLNAEASTTSQDTPKLQYQLNSAQSAYSAAEKLYNSNKATFQLGGLSEADLDTAKAAFDTAKANLETAKAALATNQGSDSQALAKLRNLVKQAEITVSQAEFNRKNAAIRAPFDGQISSITYQVGEYVPSASTVFVLVSPGKQVNFSIAPADAAKITRGASVTFRYDSQTWPLKVTNTPSAPTSGLVPMTAVATQGTLPTYGMVGTVHYSLSLGTGAQVPLGALQTKNNANFVYTVEDGKVVSRPVVILAENGSVAVLSGLTLPAQVITSPPPGLVIGASVQVVEPTSKDGSS